MLDGVEMVLPNLVLHSRVNQTWQYSGIDSPDHCFDKRHFRDYPYSIDYQYNSRGFRDAEWPESMEDLQKSIWCLGDSFTVGVGQPFEHIWCQVLSHRLGQRTINVSMDGASNDWIYRTAQLIQSQIGPRHLIVMWSYTHRRESTDINLTDEQRRIFASNDSHEQDTLHWLNLSTRLRNSCSNLIELSIPNFYGDLLPTKKLLKQYLNDSWQEIKDPSWPQCPETLDEFDSSPAYILKELQDIHNCYTSMRLMFSRLESEITKGLDKVIHVNEVLDWARDHHHFDVLTSNWAVDQILKKMKLVNHSKTDVPHGFAI